MEGYLELAVLAGFILLYGAISGRIIKTIITPPMVFVGFGLLVSGQVLGIFDWSVGNEVIDFVAELTLILVLFTDASRIDFKLLTREHNIPIRLLAIGLPLTILAGAICAALIFDFVNFWEAAILAVILAPTDAALGQAVVSNPRVPVRIRQALNVESGLNDGIALPILLFFIAVASATEDLEYSYWIGFASRQLILGPLVGVAVGYLGGALIKWSEDKEWMAESFQKLSALGLALSAFALAELIGGNGFLAAFCAGLVLGNFFQSVCRRLYDFAEADGQLLTLITFMFFGIVMILPALADFTWLMVLYAVLSLTVVRIIPVAISLFGLRLQPQTILFLGWFGPRGIASVIYGLIVIEEEAIQGREQIFNIMVITVLISIFAHGLTALPAAKAYGAQAEAMPEGAETPELAPVPEMPLRLSG